jgi:beta-galactosidase
VADLYISNAFTACVNDGDQPLGALEFDAGDANYGEEFAALSSPEATAMKSLLDIAQGTRFLNYYLLTGGINPMLDEPVGDGNDRIAFTGERHGFAAPIGPEGEDGTTLPGLLNGVRILREHNDVLAETEQLLDDVQLGFVADHYLTEYRHPADTGRREQIRGLETHRGFGARQSLSRALVLGGWNFTALDLQAAAGGDNDWSAGVERDERAGRERPAIVLATGRELGRNVQRFLADHVETGGRLMLAGKVPSRDEHGLDCTILGDALRVRSAGERIDEVHLGWEYWPSVVPAEGFSLAREVRVASAELLDLSAAAGAEPLLLESATREPAAAALTVPARDGGNDGRVVIVGADYPVHFAVWREFFARLGVSPRLETHSSGTGIVAVPVEAPDGQRRAVMINVAPYPVRFELHLDGEQVTDAGELPARGSRIVTLPNGAPRSGSTPSATSADLAFEGTL